MSAARFCSLVLLILVSTALSLYAPNVLSGTVYYWIVAASVAGLTYLLIKEETTL